MKITGHNNLNIKFRINEFPDSQQLMEIDENDIIYTNTNDNSLITITQSIRSFRDIELILNAVAALRNHNFQRIKLSIPYFLGARSDRAFTECGVHYLRDVICPIINNLKLEKVMLFDPHSDVLPSLINNSIVKTNHNFICMVIADIGNDITIIAPDHGAEKKVYSLVKNFPEVKSVVVGTKERNLRTGEITYFSISGKHEDFDDRNLLVVDDICDGGATFIKIAEKLKFYAVTPKSLNLAVTHGIFSKGLQELFKYYDKIFTTDSYRPYDDEFLSLNNQLKIFKV